jgi:3-hydroxyacyl-[acyl-carrier-protein] dehydratase
MPLNDFFTYEIIHQDHASIKALVTIDPQHRLYKGHFPGQPVTPGVVLIEIMRQVLSKSLNKKLMLTAAKEIKYLAPVLPGETKQIEYLIETSESNDAFSVNCVISWGEKVFTKIRGEFREE